MDSTRYLTLIRHAKSLWKDAGQSDFDRPLNKRGKRDAAKTGRVLQHGNVSFDKLLCSSAVRGRETLQLLKRELDLPEEVIEYSREMYLAPVETLKRIVALLPPDLKDVALIGHNPGIEELANELSLTGFDHMPTASVVRLAFDNTDGNWVGAVTGRGRIDMVLRVRDLA